MQIITQLDMSDFCTEIENKATSYSFQVCNTDSTSFTEVSNIEAMQDYLIRAEILPPKPISHLQQGIGDIRISENGRLVTISETPFLFPNPKILDNPDLQKYLGPMTGVLVNCYDPSTMRFLFQMRGKSVDVPFGFQAAAAGMGRFRENLLFTARRELEEEAKILYPKNLFGGEALDCLPFMKGKFPQPLFSFGFANDLLGFPLCSTLEDITSFESDVKTSLKERGKKPEAYHFTISYRNVERVAGELNDAKRFYGPIYESTMNFLRTLHDYII